MNHVLEARGKVIEISINKSDDQNLVVIGSRGNVMKISILQQSDFGLDFCAQDQYYDEDLALDEDLQRELMSKCQTDEIHSVRVL